LPAQGSSCYYHFDIEYDDKLNAYADGKKIVFYSGMLRFLDGDDEIAAVMGHELAHNLMGHVDASSTNRMTGAFIGLLIDAAVASQGISTGGTFGDVGQTVGHLSYSVDFEEEADYIGLYVAALAGFDITKAPNVWRRMSLEDPDGIYSSTTHPSNAARYVALNKTIYEINSKRARKQPLLPERAKLEE
ncbi:MAG: M48 family metallopeptidase, partial [Alphaproteobacteria bacterium]